MLLAEFRIQSERKWEIKDPILPKQSNTSEEIESIKKSFREMPLCVPKKEKKVVPFLERKIRGTTPLPEIRPL
jgi:hypothetical protein